MVQKMDLQILDQSIVPAHSPQSSAFMGISIARSILLTKAQLPTRFRMLLTPWRYQGHGHSCCLHSRRTHWPGPWRWNRDSHLLSCAWLVDGGPSHDPGAGRNSSHGCPYPVDVFKVGTSGSNAITFLKVYQVTPARGSALRPLRFSCTRAWMMTAWTTAAPPRNAHNNAVPW